MISRVNFVFRKPFSTNYSIENVFDTVISGIRNCSHLECTKTVLPYPSKGFIPRLRSILFLRRQKEDIYHITGDVNYVVIGLKSERVILTIHDIGFLDYKTGFRRWLLYIFWLYIPVSKAKYVTTISENTKKRIVELLPQYKDKIVVINNPLTNGFEDIACINSFNNTCPVILQIGTKENKNIPRLIKAIEDIPCKLIIVGHVSDDIKTKIDSSGILWENKENLTSLELINLYKKSDILSFISLYEGFGLPIIEGQAAGCVVITSNLEPMIEVAGDGAIKVDPTSVLEIKQALETVINNEEIRSSLLSRGYENVTRFKKNNISNQYINLYTKM